MNAGKLVIAIGLILVVVGLLMTFKVSVPWLGRLPGDIRIDRGNVKVFIPITTSILISIVLSLLLLLINKLR